MGDFPDDHDAVDILAYFVTLTDGLISNSEVQRRIQRVRHMVDSGNQRALLMFTGLIAGLWEILPNDDGWKQPGENRYGFLDVNISGGVPHLVHTLQVTDSLDISPDARRLIECARYGWMPVFECTELLLDNEQFDVVTGALRHLVRRARMTFGTPAHFWRFVAYLGAAPEVNETGLLQAVRPLKIPNGYYGAISVHVPEPPF